MRDILRDTLNACEARERLLVYPTMQGLWEGGTGYCEGQKVYRAADDITWWFVAEFASPKEAALLKRILDAIPQFFFSEGGQVDWKMINRLRGAIRRAAWPEAYDIAANSTTTEASSRASSLIRRLTTAEEWRQKS